MQSHTFQVSVTCLVAFLTKNKNWKKNKNKNPKLQNIPAQSSAAP